MYTIIQENPYKMTDDIAGVGFKIADEIAKKSGSEVTQITASFLGFFIP